MVQIGIEVSRPLLALLAAHAIDIDYVKVDGDWPMDLFQKALTYGPVLIHDISSTFWLNYEDPFQDADLRPVRKMLETARPPWFSTGIGASAEPQGHTSPNWRGAERDALQSRERVAENILRNAARLQKTVLGDMPLLLENYNYHPTNAYEYVCEPPFYSKLINEIGCGVLLDLAHARISANNMGWESPQHYLEALPLDRVREIHLSHPTRREEQMIDAHLPIDTSDVELLVWTLNHTPAEAVTLEVSENVDEAILLAQASALRTAINMSGRVNLSS